MNSTKTHISRREFKYQIPCWDHLGQSHRRFQNSSPKAQVPRFRALAEPKVQDIEPKIQEADTNMSCGDPSSQKPAFKTQDSTPKNHSISWDGDRQIPEFKTQVPETNDSPWYVLIQNPNPRMSKGADPKLGSESVITRGHGRKRGRPHRSHSLLCDVGCTWAAMVHPWALRGAVYPPSTDTKSVVPVFNIYRYDTVPSA